VRSIIKLQHPDSEDLAFLYGTIVTDGEDVFSDQPTVNLTVFADQEVRSNDQLTHATLLLFSFLAANSEHKVMNALRTAGPIEE
jgi:hypothetical protein